MDFEFSKRDLDSGYDSKAATNISCINGVIDISKNTNIMVNDNAITITAEGCYRLTGEFNNKALIVDAKDTHKIQLVLDNCNINNDNGPAVYLKSADKVFITLADSSVNTLSDGSNYEYIDGETSVDGTIFSKSDLTLNGDGTLIVGGNYKHGIVSKDDLVIASGTYEITSVKKGVNGKDCIKINDCVMTITSGTDGICSDNTEESNRGFVYINNGNLNISCGKDGIQAETVIKLDNPTINIVSGGGSANAPKKESNNHRGGRKGRDEVVETTVDTPSIKGLKAGKDIIIANGKYIFDTYDDSVHANNSIKISGGNFVIKSGDDGFHAENTLLVENGYIDVVTCYEGLEAYQILITGGETYVISSDDGVNATSADADDKDESIARFLNPSQTGRFEVTGGILAVNTLGDGLDSNGTMKITGGKIYVAGPTDGGNDSFDCDYKYIEVPDSEDEDSFLIEISKERFNTLR